jgi:PAS domain S-box-containing protein
VKSTATEPLRSPPPPAVPGLRDQWWRWWFEEAEDAQLVCTADGITVEMNRKAAQLLGVSPQAGLSVFTLFAGLTPAAALKLAELLRKPRNPPTTLSSVILICGSQANLQADLHITTLGDGYTLIALKDASRRWRMESHVTRLITAVDSTPDVIFLTDAEFRITFVNSAFQTVTGHTIEESLGRTADFLRAPGQAEHIQEYLDSIKRCTDWQGELINVRSDGSAYPVEASISPIYDRNDAFLGYVAFERDITLKKRLEAELLQERNFAISIINSLDAAVYTMDRQFQLTHFNECCKTMPREHGWLNLPSEPKAGDQFLDYVESPGRRADLARIFQEVLSTGTPQEIVAGSPRGYQWLMKVAPWFHQGEILGLIYVVNDRTKFHELERQLYQAQKMETIGALAAGVAHDFNNLLQAIRGNVSLLLLEDDTAEPIRHRLQQIDEAAGQAADITQQLLSFSRPSDEVEAVLDFNQVIQQTAQMAQRSLMSKVTVKVQPTDAPLKVRMHATRAQQMLLNLCINAQDAMAQGGQLVLSNTLVRLTPKQAARTTHPPDSQFVKTSVADSGTGIPPEVLSRIFDPFFTTKGIGKGTGLGLSIVHSICSQAGGFIEVESTPGQGTTFHLYLPTVEAMLTENARTGRAKLVKGSGRVLVVDDLDLVLDFTGTFLRAAGYEVLTASSAEEALRIIESEEKPIDLLLTDYNMAEKNGEELIQEVSVRWPRVKLILASGYMEIEQRRQIIEKYGASILNKPFNIREAAEMIAKLLPAKTR